LPRSHHAPQNPIAQGALARDENDNGAERLSVDPAMRQVVGSRAVIRSATSTNEVGRYETEVRAHPDNLATLMAMPGTWVDRVRQRRPVRLPFLDLHSSICETYADQEGSAYNRVNAERRELSVRRDHVFGVRSGSLSAAGTVVLVAEFTCTQSDRSSAPRDRRWLLGGRPGSVAGQKLNENRKLLQHDAEVVARVLQ